MPMTPDTQVLWERLRAFDFDRGPAAFTFRDRLARDTGWPRARAGRVIAEHRRFLLLAGAAGHPVSPSADVDEAWHLHLTYTRSYAIVRKPAWWPPTRAVAVTSLLLAAGVTSACVAEAFVVGGFVAIGALVMLANMVSRRNQASPTGRQRDPDDTYHSNSYGSSASCGSSSPSKSSDCGPGDSSGGDCSDGGGGGDGGGGCGGGGGD